mmetsp:Transcript_12972/g.23615  ORF Transcript_12972/g.23615 Transcript_12972/m.23615 type:complete len:188 (-) Transcript_12972:693-1256(-)
MWGHGNTAHSLRGSGRGVAPADGENGCNGHWSAAVQNWGVWRSCGGGPWPSRIALTLPAGAARPLPRGRTTFLWMGLARPVQHKPLHLHMQHGPQTTKQMKRALNAMVWGRYHTACAQCAAQQPLVQPRPCASGLWVFKAGPWAPGHLPTTDHLRHLAACARRRYADLGRRGPMCGAHCPNFHSSAP